MTLKPEASSDLLGPVTVASTPKGNPPSYSPAPRYLYYRIYCDNDSVPTKHPVSPEDPFLGRALVIRIPPPYTSSSIIQYLLKYEMLASAYYSCKLLEHVSSEFQCWDHDFINLSNPAGLGSKPGDPIAFVVEGTLASLRRKA